MVGRSLGSIGCSLWGQNRMLISVFGDMERFTAVAAQGWVQFQSFQGEVAITTKISALVQITKGKKLR